MEFFGVRVPILGPHHFPISRWLNDIVSLLMESERCCYSGSALRRGMRESAVNRGGGNRDELRVAYEVSSGARAVRALSRVETPTRSMQSGKGIDPGRSLALLLVSHLR